jgi:hypothetical protein
MVSRRDAEFTEAFSLFSMSQVYFVTGQVMGEGLCITVLKFWNAEGSVKQKIEHKIANLLEQDVYNSNHLRNRMTRKTQVVIAIF